MTKSSFILLFLINFPVLLLAQPITGISGIKIGMTEGDFLELKDVKILNPQDYSNYDDKNKNRDREAETSEALRKAARDRVMRLINPAFVIEPVIKTSEAEIQGNAAHATLWKKTNLSKVQDYSEIFAPNITEYIFYIPLTFPNTDKLIYENERTSKNDIYKIEVRFYQSRLIKINIDIEGNNEELENILVSKYGPPLKNSEIRNCNNVAGTITSVTSTWGKGKPIIALSTLYVGCGIVGGYYEIKNEEMVKRVDKINTKYKDEQKNMKYQEFSSPF